VAISTRKILSDKVTSSMPYLATAYESTLLLSLRDIDPD